MYLTAPLQRLRGPWAAGVLAKCGWGGCALVGGCLEQTRPAETLLRRTPQPQEAPTLGRCSAARAAPL